MSGLTLLLLGCLAATLVVAAGRRARAERVGLLLFIVVVGCVGVGGLLAAAQVEGPLADGRALIPCAVGPLIALSLRAELLGRLSGPIVGGVATILLVGGLSAHGAILARIPGTRVAVIVILAVTAAAAAVTAGTALRQALTLPSPLLRQRRITEALGPALMGVGAVVAGGEVLLSVGPSTLWAGLVGLGGLLAVIARTASTPPGLRELGLAAGAGLMVALVAPQDALMGVLAVAMGLAAAHGLWLPRPPGLPAVQAVPTAGAAVADAALQGLPPVLDDAAQRRPGRPRVLARTPARRLVDAAIDRAWRSTSSGRGRAPIDVVGGEDVDVDGDASELAEALCAVLDGALREQRARDGRVTITVRAAPQSISFEIDDVGADANARPFLDQGADADRDGPVSLARARILVERHGGQLHVRQGGRSAVHLTLPRRIQRGPVGLA